MIVALCSASPLLLVRAPPTCALHAAPGKRGRRLGAALYGIGAQILSSPLGIHDMILLSTVHSPAVWYGRRPITADPSGDVSLARVLIARRASTPL